MGTRQHFERGGRGVFKCQVCDRGTRRVDQAYDSECCPQCWDLAGLDNTVNDNGANCEQLGDWRAYRDQLLVEAVKHGGNADKITSEFTYLWPKEQT